MTQSGISESHAGTEVYGGVSFASAISGKK